MRKEAGHAVGGKYELLRPLGRGSMGEVWVAHHRALGQQVAVKLLSQGRPQGDFEQPVTAAARFRFEARVAARLSAKTRHIVRVTDYGEEEGEDGVAYLVMELLEGRTLESKLLVRGRLPAAEVTALVAQIARALEVAHGEGVVHRDLKPANVFITSDEDGWPLVKLLDFGIARTIHTHRAAPSFSTADGLIFGTPGYMSPEQARGGRADARSDLWALATVAYEALTGELPVPGATTAELLDNVHAGKIVPIHERDPALAGGLAPFFERAFALSVDDRYPSAAAFTAAFERAVTQDGEPALTAMREPFGPRGQTLRIDPSLLPHSLKTDPPPDGASRPRTGSPNLGFLPLSLVAVLACAGAAQALWRNASLATAEAASSPPTGALAAADRAATLDRPLAIDRTPAPVETVAAAAVAVAPPAVPEGPPAGDAPVPDALAAGTPAAVAAPAPAVATPSPAVAATAVATPSPAVAATPVAAPSRPSAALLAAPHPARAETPSPRIVDPQWQARSVTELQPRALPASNPVHAVSRPATPAPKAPAPAGPDKSSVL
jgi:serine/threonine protein kinase